MLNRHSKSTYLNPRLWVTLSLGFSSGLPLVLIGSTLQAWFTQVDISVKTIGALSLIGIPYTCKFLWAPLMDTFQLSKNSKRRGWILLTQLALCAAIIIMSFQQPEQHPYWVAGIACVIAFFSASQDIAVDAYRTDLLQAEERGLGAAFYSSAYRIAMLVAGGLGLVLADSVGWAITYQIMAGLIAISTLATYFGPEPNEEKAAPQNVWATITQSFGNLLQHKAIGWIVLFVILYKVGDAFALSLITTFLMRGLGFTLTNIGVVLKTASLIATLAGAFLGGMLLTRMTLFRALLWFGIAQSFSTLVFLVLALVGKNYPLMVAAISIENFCSAMGTTAFMAFLMSLCDHRYSATQYACLSALSSLGRVFLGPLAGLVQAQWGWIDYYAWSFALCVPGLLLLVFLRNRVSFNAA